MPALPDMQAYSRKFGKHDLDRIGLFIEMPILAPLKGKKGNNKKKKQKISLRTMLAGGPKTKTALMDAYFESEYKRIFTGEAIKGKRKEKKRIKIAIPFVPPNPLKKLVTPGDYYGTFGGFVEEFSPKLRRKPKRQPCRPNIVTNPAKKGGPGYVNITIGKYPEHKSDRGKKAKKNKKKKELQNPPMLAGSSPKPYFEQNPFKDLKDPTKRLYIKPVIKLEKRLQGLSPFIPIGPAKWIAGCKCGGFSKFPEWKKDKYLTPSQKDQILAKKANIDTKPGGIFMPPSRSYKTMFYSSIMSNIHYSMNSTNWQEYEPEYVERLLNAMY